MTTWPHPGDSPVVRARKIALAYREALTQYNPDLAKGMDARHARWGERWCMTEPVIYDDDEWVPTETAAGLIHISTGRLSRLRVTGRISGRKRADGRGLEFRVGDVYKLSTQLRPRTLPRRTSPDKVPDNGSSVTHGQS